ncbi:50S ribosomal protein L22 [Candidatus Woesearchaeota archaeon CG_4_10_14_0_2_um_filter_33_13]|nr:MAG: 50S ribosomal protein L22 [Candidatus Woesearchaeota archaeon CG_4_10_14_0_2_um_filter_33_13]
MVTKKIAKKDQVENKDHMASAKSLNLAISTKHGVEISSFLRFKPLSFAKSYLEEVANLRKAIPFNRFKRNVGHKPGMAAGRFPEKAAKEFLKLLNSVEANAQFKGLNIANLKIVKLLVNKAALPMTGSRHRRSTKRTHIEVEVKEMGVKKKDSNKEASAAKPVKTKIEKKEAEKKENTTKTVKKETQKVKEDQKEEVKEAKEE